MAPRILAAAGLLLLAAGAAMVAAGPPVDAERSFARAESILRQRFSGARNRVERAVERLAAVDAGAPSPAAFAEAARIVREEAVDGGVVLDLENRARFWGGRTFDVSPRTDFPSVWRGFSETGVLDRPAHLILYAAKPRAGEAAVAFLAMQERFPGGTDFAAEVAGEAGLASVRLRYGEGTVPALRDERLERTFVIDGLVHVTLRALDGEGTRFAEARRAHRRDSVFLGLLGTGAAAGLWLGYGRRLPRGSLRRLLLALLLFAALRLLLPTPLWGPPWRSAATGLSALLMAAAVARGLPSPGPHGLRLAAALLALGAALLLPRLHLALAASAVRAEPELFDPRQVFPGLPAAGVLAAVAMLTGALFLLARALSRLAGPLAHAAIAIGALSPAGAALGACCALASLALRRAGGRPERAVALTFLSALACFPAIFPVWKEARTERIAERTREFLAPERLAEVRTLLARAAAAVTDPEEGVDRELAARIAAGEETSRLAFRAWGAARWTGEEACAVQVWERTGELLSAFDFDSPPSRWLLRPPDEGAEGFRPYEVRLEETVVRYYAQDIPLRPIGEERVVGTLRFLVPDRWDALLARARPSIFSEPLTRILGGGTPPFLLAEVDRQGRVTASSEDASLDPVGAPLLEEAEKRGFSEGATRCRGRESRILLVPSEAGFAALLFRPPGVEQMLLAFAKIVLVHAALCLLFLLSLLLSLRARPVILFRHRIAWSLVLLSVPPVLLMGHYNRKVAEERHEADISERLERRLDLAESLLRKEQAPVDNAWCAAFAADHRTDLNLYARGELFATSRPGVWDTGLLGRRLPAPAFVALGMEGARDATALEHFGRPGGIRVAYRLVRGGWGGDPVVAAAPALEDRRDLERRAAEANALLLAAYLLTAATTIFFALFLARSVTAPVGRLLEATKRVAGGDFRATLPEKGRDEFGQLIGAFNRMTRDLADAQELRVRAEKEAAWREMARQVAHEIKNPLTPIKLTIQNLLALEREDPDAFRAEFRAGSVRILEQIEALRRIADAFSHYGRFPSPELAVVELAPLLGDVAALYASSGEVEATSGPAPLLVRADRDELRRALINLVTNARQAGAKRIRLRADGERDRIRIEVSDDGSGIAPEILPRLFEPAFTTKTSGTGLGLAIVKRIVTDLGGTISVDSAPGRGTRVILRLPRAAPSA